MKINFLTAVLLVFTVSLLSAGCGESEKPKTDSEKSQTQTTETKTETVKDTVTAEKKDSLTTKKDEKKLDIVKFETTLGTFKVKLYSEKAPVTTDNFRSLVEKGFYDGIIFHRVIDGFMIQGGDPTGTGRGGSGKTIPDEFGQGLKHSKKGILSMANAGPNTGTSQFFITLNPQPHLDGKHAVFGEVTEGMSVVEKIGKVKTGAQDRPVEEVKMTKVTMTEE